MCVGNGDCTLVVDVWLHRVDEDTSGLTFEEWDPSSDTDASEAPVAMIVNSSELCPTGFDLREVLPIQLEVATRGDRRTNGAALKADSRHGYQEVCTLLRVYHVRIFHHNNRGKID